MCDRGPPSFETRPCGTRAVISLARAILMAPTPLVSHFVHCFRLRSYRLPAPYNRAPVEPYRVLLPTAVSPVRARGRYCVTSGTARLPYCCPTGPRRCGTKRAGRAILLTTGVPGGPAVKLSGYDRKSSSTDQSCLLWPLQVFDLRCGRFPSGRHGGEPAEPVSGKIVQRSDQILAALGGVVGQVCQRVDGAQDQPDQQNRGRALPIEPGCPGGQQQCADTQYGHAGRLSSGETE